MDHEMSTVLPNPPNFEVVQLLMERDPDTFRKVGKEDNVRHLVYCCPRGDLYKPKLRGGNVIFAEGSGYSNPCKHLRSCLANEDENELLKIYQKGFEQKQQSTTGVTDYFTRLSSTANN